MIAFNLSGKTGFTRSLYVCPLFFPEIWKELDKHDLVRSSIRDLGVTVVDLLDSMVLTEVALEHRSGLTAPSSIPARKKAAQIEHPWISSEMSQDNSGSEVQMHSRQNYAQSASDLESEGDLELNYHGNTGSEEEDEDDISSETEFLGSEPHDFQVKPPESQSNNKVARESSDSKASDCHFDFEFDEPQTKIRAIVSKSGYEVETDQNMSEKRPCGRADQAVMSGKRRFKPSSQFEPGVSVQAKRRRTLSADEREEIVELKTMILEIEEKIRTLEKARLERTVSKLQQRLDPLGGQ
eukprot:TRINITY_DN5503_c0_g1_i4.p2 TRINITY_DN5503_c0_g1~~TRINITY_DN5503_c0_g1_i4.p2  ORF type:complete len:296 (+),score=79.71 TRINITY_DN5503_c0_g1_i4:932-1819(+)